MRNCDIIPLMKNTHRFRVQFAVLLVLALALVACSDDALLKVSNALKDVALATAAVQQITIDGNKAGVISENDTRTILLLCGKLNTGGQQASQITRGLKDLPATQRGQLLVVLTPLLDAVKADLQTGVIKITNPDTRIKVESLLTTMQTGLTIAVTVLEGNR